MHRLSFVFSILLALSATVHAQLGPEMEWNRSYNYVAWASDMIVTNDQHVIVAGSTSTFSGLSDGFIMKIDSEGDTLWLRRTDSENGNWFTSITEAEGGSILAVGKMQSGANDYNHLQVAKVNQGGDFVWSTIAEINGWGYNPRICEAADGGAFVASVGVDSLGDRSSLILTRFDASGNYLWTHPVHTNTEWIDDGLAAFIRINEDSLLIVAAGRHSIPASDPVIALVNSNADTFWTRTIETPQWEGLKCAYRTPDGGFMVAADSNQALGGATLMKFDLSGNLMWTRFCTEESDYVLVGDLDIDSDGTILMSGARVRSGEFETFGFLKKMNSEGDQIWLNDYEELMGVEAANMCVRFTDHSCCMLQNSNGLGPSGFSLFMTVPETEQAAPARLPETIVLLNAYPNPFNPSTTISFSLPRSENVELTVHDLLGRGIATLHSGLLTSGEYKFDFDGTGLPSGVYVYRLQGDGFSTAQKMLLLK
jgi:hypothetical protein